MKTEYIYEFVRLVESESFSKAARELFISQPTLTKHIQQLESDLGHRLIDREQPGFKLTYNGTIFYEYAMHMVYLNREYAGKYIETDNLDHSSVSIGISAMPLDIYKSIDKSLLKLYEDIDIFSFNTTQINSLEKAFSLLRSDKIRLALVSGFENCFNGINDISRICLKTEICALVVSENHELANRSHFVNDFARDMFVAYPYGTIQNYLFKKICQFSGFEPKIQYTTNSIDMIYNTIRKNRCIAVLPESLLTDIPAGIKVIYPVIPINQRTYILKAGKSILRPAERKLLAELSDVFSKTISFY